MTGTTTEEALLMHLEREGYIVHTGDQWQLTLKGRREVDWELRRYELRPGMEAMIALHYAEKFGVMVT